MKYEFGGITTEVNKEILVEDVFEKVYESDDEEFYLSKKIFRHEEEDFNFDYKYAIHTLNMELITGEQIPLEVSLSLIVAPNSLKKEVVNKILDYVGDGWDEVSENYKYKDITDYGLSVPMIVSGIKDSSFPYEDNKELQFALKSICAIYNVVDGLRGFYLDRVWNRVGSTGWDIIRECITGENFIQSTLKRYEGIEN